VSTILSALLHFLSIAPTVDATAAEDYTT